MIIIKLIAVIKIVIIITGLCSPDWISKFKCCLAKSFKDLGRHLPCLPCGFNIL